MLSNKWLQKPPLDLTAETAFTPEIDYSRGKNGKSGDPLEEISSYSRMSVAIKKIADVYSPLIAGDYSDRMRALDWLVCEERNPEITPLMIEQWEQGYLDIIKEWWACHGMSGNVKSANGESV